MEALCQNYFVEIILGIGLLLSGPLARLIVDDGTCRNAAEKQADLRRVALVFRVMFAGLLALSLAMVHLLGS